MRFVFEILEEDKLAMRGLAYPFLHHQTLVMSKKISTIEIAVPYKRAGGIIHQQKVAFEVFQLDGYYQLKPCLSLEERRLANLPEELSFKMENVKPVSLRGKMDGNFHVIRDVVTQLQKEQQLV